MTLLLGCSLGDEVGNGGDPLSKIFEEARPKASMMLDAVTSLEPEDFPDRRAPRVKEVREFYDRYRDFLDRDLEATPEYIWVRKNRNNACGRTSAFAGAPVFLSYEDCRRIQTRTDAALQVLTESVHHAGIADDVFAALTATAIGNAWLRKIGESPEGYRVHDLFARAPAHAAEILLRFREPDRELLPTFSEEDWRWLRGKTEDLAKDLVAAKQDWVAELPRSAANRYPCVRLRTEGSSLTLELGYEGCRQRVANRDEAGELLLTALIARSSKRTDDFPKRLARQVYALWSALGHPTAPHLLVTAMSAKNFSQEIPLDSYRDAQAEWAGDRLVQWAYVDNEDALRMVEYRARDQEWTPVKPENSYTGWYLPGKVNDRLLDEGRPSTVSNGSEIYFFTQCPVGRRKKGVGQRFDTKTRRWTEIDGDFDRRTFRLAAVGDKVLLWGGYDCKTGKIANDGFLFDPATERWEAIAGPKTYEDRHDYSLTVIGNDWALWGGCNFLHNDCPSTGEYYDRRKRTWRPLPTENAPEPRWFHQAAWTGKYLLVYSGCPPFPDVRKDKIGEDAATIGIGILQTGGRLDLKAGKWEPMNIKNTIRFPAQAVWVPPYWINIGTYGTALYNPARDEWTKLERISIPNWRRLFWTGMELLIWHPSQTYAFYF